jgi:uncharacterized RDD family membrane protein YckC
VQRYLRKPQLDQPDYYFHIASLFNSMTDPNTLDDAFVSMQNEKPEPVSSWHRLGNFIIDSIAMVLIKILLGVNTAGFDGMLSIDSWMSVYLYNALFGLVYYGVLESASGVTLGKLVTGTKVVDANGNKPTLSKVFIRSLCRYIPFEPFSFLAGRMGWHDSISGTVVIRS